MDVVLFFRHFDAMVKFSSKMAKVLLQKNTATQMSNLGSLKYEFEDRLLNSFSFSFITIRLVAQCLSRPIHSTKHDLFASLPALRSGLSGSLGNFLFSTFEMQHFLLVTIAKVCL